MVESFEKSDAEQSEISEPGGLKLKEEREHGFWRKHWERFKEKAIEILGKGKELPPISIEIFYAPHSSAEDLQGFSESFERSDIFIPELSGWRVVDLEYYRKIADGDVVPQEYFKTFSATPQIKEFLTHLLNRVASSKKPITFIDLPAGHELLRKPRGYETHKSFSETLHRVSEHLKGQALFQKEREEYMLKMLRPRIAELLREYPELKKKKELCVLLFLGYLHTTVYYELQKGGVDVKRSFGFSPLVFGREEEAVRRIRFGKEVDNEFCARVLAEDLFFSFTPLCHITEISGELISRYMRRELKNLSFGDIKEIHDALASAGLSGVSGRVCRAFVEKGVHIPTKEDIIAFKNHAEKKPS
ncbi:MAG: hypothetical protein HYW90_04230 [Candidatus Sungbacteria bacterium]|nr:hypothetical protein [Candidatus Sungbacteria bacterium]